MEVKHKQELKNRYLKARSLVKFKSLGYKSPEEVGKMLEEIEGHSNFRQSSGWWKYRKGKGG